MPQLLDEVVGEVQLDAVQFLFFESGANLILHLVKGFEVRRLFIEHLDDFDTVVRLDDAAHLAGRKRKRHVLQLFLHLAALDPSRIAAV